MADKEETIALIVALLREQEDHIAKAYISESAQSRRIIRLTMAQLEADLLAVQWGTWSAMERAATMAMVRRAFVQLGGRLTGSMSARIPSIVSQSMIDTQNFLEKLDQNFAAPGTRTGLLRPMRFDTLEFLARTNAEIGQIRLREFPQSFRRYGAAAVVAIEEQLGVISLQGIPWTEARDEVWDTVRHVVQEKQWMVERILRTETSAIANGTEFAAIREEAKDDSPDDRMMKRIIATFDEVTHFDSVAVHGQIRAPDDMFEDGMGRRYLFPPGRPNDREIIVPWRSSYEEFFPDFPRIVKEGSLNRPNISIPREMQPIDDIFTEELRAETRLLNRRLAEQRKLLSHFRTQMRTLEGEAAAQFGGQIAQTEFSIRALRGEIAALSG